jgi:WD repeat-containing protein 45
MNLARHSITATNPVHIFDARFEADCNIFTVSTPAGFAVYRTRPLKLLRKRGIDPSHPRIWPVILMRWH